MGTALKKARIGIIGDLLLDKYIFGVVDRISPEAPIPIVAVKRETYVPGGAANTANNVAALKGEAFLFGILGKDQEREVFLKETRSRGIRTDGVIERADRRTIQKIRVIGQNQQLLRIDYEDDLPGDEGLASDLEKLLEKNADFDALVVSDYAKGVVSENLMNAAKEISLKRKWPLIVDPKPQHKAWYRGVFLITPNRKEAEAMVNFRLDSKADVERAGNLLMRELGCHVLITMGERGMSLFERGHEPHHIPTQAREVFDVSGAGDTVVAVLAMMLSSGAALRDAAQLANVAAGIKVGKLGTAPVSFDEIQSFL